MSTWCVRVVVPINKESALSGSQADTGNVPKCIRIKNRKKIIVKSVASRWLQNVHGTKCVWDAEFVWYLLLDFAGVYSLAFKEVVRAMLFIDIVAKPRTLHWLTHYKLLYILLATVFSERTFNTVYCRILIVQNTAGTQYRWQGCVVQYQYRLPI